MVHRRQQVGSFAAWRGQYPQDDTDGQGTWKLRLEAMEEYKHDIWDSDQDYRFGPAAGKASSFGADVRDRCMQC